MKLLGADFSEGSNWAKRCAADQLVSAFLHKYDDIHLSAVYDEKMYSIMERHIFDKLTNPAYNET